MAEEGAVPVLDLRHWHGTPSQRAQLLRDVRVTCAEVPTLPSLDCPTGDAAQCVSSSCRVSQCGGAAAARWVSCCCTRRDTTCRSSCSSPRLARSVSSSTCQRKACAPNPLTPSMGHVTAWAVCSVGWVMAALGGITTQVTQCPVTRQHDPVVVFSQGTSAGARLQLTTPADVTDRRVTDVWG